MPKDVIKMDKMSDIFAEYSRSFPYTEKAVERFWNELDRRNKVNRRNKDRNLNGS